jgi:hypothetical protein
VYAYGYGLDRRGSYYGHEGVINGYNTAMSTDPQTGTTVIAVATLTLSPDGAPVARLLADTVKSALAGLPGSAPTSSNEAGALSPEETARP